MSYISLGMRPATASLNNNLDSTGRNTGNWTAVLGPSNIAINHNYFELYHLAIQGGPAGSILTIYLDNAFYDTTPNAMVNSWDPNQPLIMQPGDTLYFYWNKATGTAPLVTAYFRYDTTIQ